MCFITGLLICHKILCYKMAQYLERFRNSDVTLSVELLSLNGLRIEIQTHSDRGLQTKTVCVCVWKKVRILPITLITLIDRSSLRAIYQRSVGMDVLKMCISVWSLGVSSGFATWLKQAEVLRLLWWAMGTYKTKVRFMCVFGDQIQLLK